MERNFWTEENKILDYDALIRVDMRNKLMKMSNQIVVGGDIADLCYNYDYFIVEKDKAIQFIVDYANEFVKSLERYQRTFGKMFPSIKDPLKMATLMALYQGKKITRKSEMVRNAWNSKLTLDRETLDTLLKEIEGPELPEDRRLVGKVLTSKETLEQLCVEYLLEGLNTKLDKCATLNEAVAKIDKPQIGEKSARSILKNDYAEVAAFALGSNCVETKDLKSFVESIVCVKAREMISQELDLNERVVPLNKETLRAIGELFQAMPRHEVEFRPIVEEKPLMKGPQVQREK